MVTQYLYILCILFIYSLKCYSSSTLNNPKKYLNLVEFILNILLKYSYVNKYYTVIGTYIDFINNKYLSTSYTQTYVYKYSNKSHVYITIKQKSLLYINL